MKISAVTPNQAINAKLKIALQNKSARQAAKEMGIPQRTLCRIVQWIDEYGIIDTFDPNFVPPHRGNGSPELMYEMLDKQSLWDRALMIKQHSFRHRPKNPEQLTFEF